MPKRTDSVEANERKMTEWFIGMAASLGDVILSGFVSIYFEKVLKSKTETYSVWDRNFQLAFWSMVIYFPWAIYEHPTAPFHGWSAVTVTLALLGAIGGILVALVIKYGPSFPPHLPLVTRGHPLLTFPWCHVAIPSSPSLGATWPW